MLEKVMRDIARDLAAEGKTPDMLTRLLGRMDVPAARITDYRWLQRNLGIQNREHPDYGLAMRLIGARLGDEYQ